MEVAWRDVDWEALTEAYARERHSPETGRLLQPAIDTMDVPAAELCGSATNLCALGIFFLRTVGVIQLLRSSQLSNDEAAAMIEPNAAEFVSAFQKELKAPDSLWEEFGEDRGPISMPQVGMQLLGRIMHQVSGLPATAESPGTEADGQFSFGENWKQFVQHGRITAIGLLSAAREVRRAVGGTVRTLRGLKVLDLGCGSGLQSLAFHLQGAIVQSVDVQEASLEATRFLRSAAQAAGIADMQHWAVDEASAMHTRQISSLGPVDVVYSWGVLHHTGDVWQALHNAQLALADDGLLLVALYADEYYDEKDNLLLMKRFYNNATTRRRESLEVAVGLHWLRPLLRSGISPFKIVREFSENRGMDLWTDVRDWLGGWPTEFTSATNVMAFARRSGLHCIGVRRYGGNTEFQLARPAGVQRWTTGRQCMELRGFRRDVGGSFWGVIGGFYALKGRQDPARQWWIADLPEPLITHADNVPDPIRHRLLLLDASGTPFGYPSAQFAHLDGLLDMSLRFFAFWERHVVVSPADSDDAGALQQLRACLLPDAELSESEVEQVRRDATSLLR